VKIDATHQSGEMKMLSRFAKLTSSFKQTCLSRWQNARKIAKFLARDVNRDDVCSFN